MHSFDFTRVWIDDFNFSVAITFHRPKIRKKYNLRKISLIKWLMLMSCTHVLIVLYFPFLVVLFWNFVNKLLVHSALKSYKGAILESSHSIQAFFFYFGALCLAMFTTTIHTRIYLLSEKYYYYYFFIEHVNDLFIF